MADLCAEHYSWTAGGDESNPDAATVQDRAAAFVSRLDTLFMEGNILAMPDTFTGVTLKFLRKTSRYSCCNSVQIVGLGDWKTQPVRDVIKTALRRVQTIVANVKENMKLYRAKYSWLHSFAAFRLPSPLTATDAGVTESKARQGNRTGASARPGHRGSLRPPAGSCHRCHCGCFPE